MCFFGKGKGGGGTPHMHGHKESNKDLNLTSIHEVVGSSPTRRSKFSNLNLYYSPCVRACGVFPPPLPFPKKTHSLYLGRGD